jgi:penicillin-binding protein 1A
MIKKTKKVLIIVLFAFCIFILIVISAFFIIRKKLRQDLPDIKSIAENPPVASQFFDRNGDFIASEQLDQYRIALPYASIPEKMRLAIVASEDERFFKHHGYDIIAITRALFNNLLHKGTQGGSTISQQLARDLFFQRDKKTAYFDISYIRKLKEMLLAIELEKKYTKEEILEYFMNYEYFGPGPPGYRAYGVEAAARNFFGKSVTDVTLSEAAIIAGTLDAPSLHSPWESAEKAKSRGNFVLEKMLRNKFITKDEYEKALITSIEAPDSPNRTDVSKKDQQGIVLLKLYNQKSNNDAKNYFVDYVKQQILTLFPENAILREGLKIYTTMDMNLQNTVMETMSETFTQAEKDGYFPKNLFDKFKVQQPQGQVVIMEPGSGKILAMVGGRDFINAQFNRCTAYRQPGSLFKIFDYTSAVDSGVVGTGTIITSDQFSMVDQETKVWVPEEWTGKGTFFGPITVQQALIKSSNICAIKVAQRVGWNRVAYYAQKMGISRYILPVPSMAIGSLEVSPLEMATAFGVLANKGEKALPMGITKITTKDDKLIYEFEPKTSHVLNKDTTAIMDILFKNVFEGLNGNLGFDAGGKTGTSEDFLSGWFCGYTPDMVVCSWIGRDSREVTQLNARLWGSAFAAPMVRSLMKKIITRQDSWKGSPFLKKTPFPGPENVSSFKLCPDSGLQATSYCPNFVWSTYIKGFGPTQYCTIHGVEFVYVKICATTGLLANQWCPKDEVIEKAFLKGTEPKEYCHLHLPPLTIHFDPEKKIAGQPVNITFQIGSQSGDRIELIIDGIRVAILEKVPYEYEWIPEKSGKHHITVVLRKNEDHIDQQEIDVEVSEP